MRISITGEASVIEALSALIADDPDSSVESIGPAKDKSELAFAFGDIATIVSTVAGLAKVVELLINLKPALDGKTQKLSFRTALGVTTVELSQDITLEELHRQLGTLVPAR
jgi:hypothetical protein